MEQYPCWDLAKVRPFAEVQREANEQGVTIHIGSLHELCMEKGSELEEGNPERKYKGGVVFLGDRVRDQNGQVAIFEEMASSPAGLEASKLCDFYGLLHPNYIHNSNQGGNLFGDLIKKTVESINQNVKYQMNLQHALIGAFKNNQNECQVCDVFCNEIKSTFRVFIYFSCSTIYHFSIK